MDRLFAVCDNHAQLIYRKSELGLCIYGIVKANAKYLLICAVCIISLNILCPLPQNVFFLVIIPDRSI